MEEKDLHIASKRILKLIDTLIANGTIKYRQEAIDVMGLHKQHYRQIKVEKKQNFTLEHITKACKKYKVNMNWVFGFEKEMFRTK